MQSYSHSFGAPTGYVQIQNGGYVALPAPRTQYVFHPFVPIHQVHHCSERAVLSSPMRVHQMKQDENLTAQLHDAKDRLRDTEKRLAETTKLLSQCEAQLTATKELLVDTETQLAGKTFEAERLMAALKLSASAKLLSQCEAQLTATKELLVDAETQLAGKTFEAERLMAALKVSASATQGSAAVAAWEEALASPSQAMPRDQERRWSILCDTLHDQLDDARDGLVSLDQVEETFAEFSALLSQSKTLKTKRDKGESLTKEEFRTMLEELQLLSLVHFFCAVQIPEQLAVKARLLMPVTRVDDVFRPFANLAKDDCATLAAHLLGKILPSVVEQAKAEMEYTDAVREEEWYGEMRLSSRALFDKGLEGILGRAAQGVLEAMEREHLQAADSHEEFEAWNRGRTLTTTSASQWEKVLPGGRQGPINNCTYEGEKMCEDIMEMDIVKRAKLQKAEAVAIRLYSGPMFKKYNTVVRDLRDFCDRHMERLFELRRPTAEEEARELDTAIGLAHAELGRRYATTILAINSALVKIGRITPLPPSGFGYRGVAGLRLPACFSQPDAYGGRGGVEGGFISLSTGKEEALGYIQPEKGRPMMFEVRLDEVNRGAYIGDLSFFPSGETNEYLLPPLSYLGVNGPFRYERTSFGWIKLHAVCPLTLKRQVVPLSVHINTKSRSVEEIDASRKEILLISASDALQSVDQRLGELRKGDDVAQRTMSGCIEDSEEAVAAMLGSITGHCQASVAALRNAPYDQFNDDLRNKLAHEEIAELKSEAEGVVELWLSGGVRDAKAAAQLDLKEAKQERLRHTMSRLEEAKAEAEAAAGGGSEVLSRVRELSLTACRIMHLFARGIEEQDSQGFTPLLRNANQGFTLAVGVLADAGANCFAAEPRQEDTALHLALRGSHTETVRRLIECEEGLVHTPNKRAELPLHLAVRIGDQGITAELVRKQRSVDGRDKDGKTALQLAAELGHAELVTLLSSYASEDKSERFKTALLAACTNGHFKAVEALVWREPDVGPRNGEQVTALMISSERGDEKAVQRLLWLKEARDTIDAINEEGLSAVMLAAREGHVPVVARLVGAKANVTIKDRSERTALDLACEADHANPAMFALLAPDTPQQGVVPEVGMSGGGEEHKYVARELKMGKSAVAGKGLRPFMSKDYRQRQLRGVDGMRDEFERHGTAEDKANFQYVVEATVGDAGALPAHVKEQIATHKYHGGFLGDGEFDEGHEGMTLQSFIEHPNSVAAGLEEEEVLALRLYTTSSFPRYNRYFRDVGEAGPQTPHPFEVTVYYLDQGLKKLRAVGAQDPETFNAVNYLYRGMKDMELDFVGFRKSGGTELAPMSTTADFAIAKQYAHSRSPLILKYKTQGLSRGCPIDYLSVYPKEKEYLYPPLTYLMQDGEIVEEEGFIIVGVTPQMS